MYIDIQYWGYSNVYGSHKEVIYVSTLETNEVIFNATKVHVLGE